MLGRGISVYNGHDQINNATFEAYKRSVHLVLKATITVCITQESQCVTSVKFIIPELNI
jgi:hypothetical protein